MGTNRQGDTTRLQTLSRQQFWQRHIEQCQQSGLSKMAYCHQYTLTYHQMVYWSKKLEPKSNQPAPAGSFVPVKFAARTDQIELSVRLPNGIAIENITEHNVNLVARIVEQL